MTESTNISQDSFALWQIDRQCKPTLDPDTLVLHEVDRSEKIYMKSMVNLKGASLRSKASDEFSGAIKPSSWDLAVQLNYIQTWTPSCYGLGDLIYTMSLLPGEEIVLEMKTWQTDRRLENEESSMAERSLSDVKDTNSNSSSVSNAVNTKEHTGVDAKASYSGFGFSAEVSASWSSDVATSQENKADLAKQRITQEASELKATRTVKMEVSREIGSESKTTRRIRNMNQTHTLNATFYQVLQELQITMEGGLVELIVLGPVAYISNPARLMEFNSALLRYESGLIVTGWNFEDGRYVADPKQELNLGQLIKNSSNPVWSSIFTEVHGTSPTSLLKILWSSQLFTHAAFSGSSTNPKQKCMEFQQTMQQYLLPIDGWVEADETGTMCWAYKVTKGKEKAFLKHFASFTKQTIDQKAIISEFSEATKNEGKQLNFDQSKFFSITVPTPGVVAEVNVGICSGGEDNFEIQRQLELEIKKQALEKLRRETEQTAILNELIKNEKIVPIIHIGKENLEE